jgi:hypothetical protein
MTSMKDINKNKNISLMDIINIISELQTESESHVPIETDDNKIENNLKPYDLCSMENVCDLFDDIFNTNKYNVFRNGIFSKNTTFNKSTNISLFNSFLHTHIDNYNLYSYDEQVIQCSKLEEFICQRLPHVNEAKNYKNFGWKINDMITDIKKNIITQQIIQLMSDIFNINIIIFNINDKILEGYHTLPNTKKIAIVKDESEKKLSFGKRYDNVKYRFEYIEDHNFNPLKQTIFLSFINDIYEPIFTKNKNLIEKNFTFPHIFIKNIIKNLDVISWYKPQKQSKKSTTKQKNITSNNNENDNSKLEENKLYVPSLSYNDVNYDITYSLKNTEIHLKNIDNILLINHYLDTLLENNKNDK